MDSLNYFEVLNFYQSEIAHDRKMLEIATSEQRVDYWQRKLEKDENALERYVNGGG